MSAGGIAVADEALTLRRIAEAGPIGKRHASFELYDLLGGCMRLAVRCASGSANAELRMLVAQQNTRGNRRYVEHQSDEYTLVCRYVFNNLKSRSAERSNASRYAHCLRQAGKLQIAADALAAHLKEHGGINALFLQRPLSAGIVTTRCLRLTKSITVPKNRAVQLVIRREPDNRFEVLECSGPEWTPRASWHNNSEQPQE